MVWEETINSHNNFLLGFIGGAKGMIQNTTIQEDQRRRFSLGDFERTGSKKGLTLTKQFWVGAFD